ncbi:hypothetical protein F0L17_24525 [Streptomyces sp. TRM43335]|uniref:Uncharacterized protein n=1 Tax=Streptomyces taklimakanensis TaxID=2569853 RepID=A0A6G2BIU0_9ACTN|nr:hypothetical protein [Streptomyces taklimakanensis]MTE22207.1 hypothetical protein [Streptomyces taklimakanensis]
MLTGTGAAGDRDAPRYGTASSEPAGEDDRGRWVVGDCWLWCERIGTAVTWLGPVISWGTHAPLYACDDCIGRLEEQVREAASTHRNAACWLWCGRGDVPLVPLAEVGHRGGTTVFHACEECVDRVKQRVLALAMGKDTAKR